MEGIKLFCEQQDIVEISQANIYKFASNFESHQLDYFEKIIPSKVPLNFKDSLEECNFFALVHLLSVGSMFEHRSQEANQSTLSDIILYGVFGAYIQHPQLNTSFMKQMMTSDVGKLF